MIVASFLLILSFIFSQKNKVTYSLWVTKLFKRSDLFSLTLNRGCFLCFYVHFGDWWINCFPSVASRICIITSFIILFICWVYCYFVLWIFFLTNKQNTSQNQKEGKKRIYRKLWSTVQKLVSHSSPMSPGNMARPLREARRYELGVPVPQLGRGERSQEGNLRRQLEDREIRSVSFFIFLWSLIWEKELSLGFLLCSTGNSCYVACWVTKSAHWEELSCGTEGTRLYWPKEKLGGKPGCKMWLKWLLWKLSQNCYIQNILKQLRGET